MKPEKGGSPPILRRRSAVVKRSGGDICLNAPKILGVDKFIQVNKIPIGIKRIRYPRRYKLLAKGDIGARLKAHPIWAIDE